MNYFDLQLFAEEEQPEVTEQQDSTSEEQEQQQEEPQKQPEFGITEDGEIVFNDSEEEQQEESQEEKPQYYSEEELKNANFNNIDPSKLPPELQALYRSMQAPFTKAMQEIAEAKKKLEPQQQQPTQQQEQADPRQIQRQYYEQVHNVAKSNVEKALGEQFDEFNPLHISALADEVANIKAYVVQTQQQQRALQNTIHPYEQDPEWNNIRDYGKQVLDSLPYQQSLVIRQRLESGDLMFLRDFLETTKNEYYKSKNPQQTQQVNNKPKPPLIESGGNGTSQTLNKTFDPKALGKMTNDEKAKVFVDLGLVDM